MFLINDELILFDDLFPDFCLLHESVTKFSQKFFLVCFSIGDYKLYFRIFSFSGTFCFMASSQELHYCKNDCTWCFLSNLKMPHNELLAISRHLASCILNRD